MRRKEEKSGERGSARVLSIVVAGLVAIWLPQGAFATGFDFDLLELEITGPLSFFDDFEDGVKNISLAEAWGVTTESGGALRFTDTDECLVRPNGRCNDLVFLAPIFRDGAGTVEITATLAPVTPTTNRQFFGLLLDVDPLPEPVFGIRSAQDGIDAPSTCGDGLEVIIGLLPQDGSGDPLEMLGCDAIDPAAVTGSIVLKQIVDDKSNEVHSLYSIDGGTTFIDTSEFDAPAPPITGFPPLPTYSFGMVAQGGVMFCPSTRTTGCLSAAKASLSINEKNSERGKLKASLKGLDGATTQSDFGNPVSGSTLYNLCLYNGAGDLVEDLVVERAADLCGTKGKDCWKAKGEKGWSYKDPVAASDGVKKIAVASGAGGKGKIQVQAGNNSKKGQVSMPVGIAEALQNETSATLQVLIDDGVCVEATLTNVKKADGVQFKAKTP